jgi:ATP-dependent DNA ligase
MREAEALVSGLSGIRCDQPGLTVPREVRRARVIWVKPRVVATVRYCNRTSDGLLRHPVFERLAIDRAIAG